MSETSRTIKTPTRFDDIDNDPLAVVRRRELAEQLSTRVNGVLVPPNETFAAYVQSSAFQINLSRNLIRALATIERAILADYELAGVLVSPSHITSLVRRGMVVALGCSESRPARWSDCYKMTRVGELTLELLHEAGFVEHRALRRPLPPPPPGWLDPRPRLVPSPDGLVVMPSRRAEAAATSTDRPPA